MRKSALLTMVMLVGPLVNSSIAQEQPISTKPVQLVVPFAAGGSADAVARVVAEAMRETLRRPVIVENKPGGNTVIAAKHVISSPADGSVVMLASATTLTVPAGNPATFDPINDFVAIGSFVNLPMGLVVRADSPFKTLQDVIDFAKANPGKLTKAANAYGSTDHLTLELLKLRAKVDILVVPYKGAAPALNDLLGGVVDMRVDALPSSLPFIAAGKLRALAVAEPKRSALLPDVPTFAESGLPGFEARSFLGLVGPKGMAPDVVAQLNRGLNEAVARSGMAERMRSMGVEPLTGTPTEFGDLMKKTFVLWSNVIKESGLKIE